MWGKGVGNEVLQQAHITNTILVMVTMPTNPFHKSMGQRVTCMGALHPNPKFICLHQFNVTKQREDLHFTFTLESRCVDLNGKHN